MLFGPTRRIHFCDSLSSVLLLLIVPSNAFSFALSPLCIHLAFHIAKRLLWKARRVWRVHLTGEPQSDVQVRSVQGPLLKHLLLPPGPGALRALSCGHSSSMNVSGDSRVGCERDSCPPSALVHNAAWNWVI